MLGLARRSRRRSARGRACSASAFSARATLRCVAHEVDRQLDRARLGVHPALDGLADPPRRVGGEAVAAAPVELLDRADQAEDALLDQVEQRQLGALVLLGDRDDEAQVRVDHAVLGGEVAALDPLGEVDLLVGREQPVAADLVEEQLQRVGRDGRERGVVDRRGSAPRGRSRRAARCRARRAARRGAPRSASSSSSAWASSSTSLRSRQPRSSPRSMRAAIGAARRRRWRAVMLLSTHRNGGAMQTSRTLHRSCSCVCVTALAREP